MMTQTEPNAGAAMPQDDRRELTPAARRALAEAAERRETNDAQRPPPEVQGRGGLEPVRYGDWEVKGLASDF